MKKIIVSFLVIFSSISIVKAEYNKEHQFVIKIGSEITVYKIIDLGNDSYGLQDFRIRAEKLVNPTLWDLRCAGAPEEAYRMCSYSENGFYSSEQDKVSQELQNLRDSQADYEDQLKDAERKASGNKVIIISLIAGLVVLALLALYLGRKIETLEKNNSQK